MLKNDSNLTGQLPLYLAVLLERGCRPRSPLGPFGQGTPRCGYPDGFRMGREGSEWTWPRAVIGGPRGAFLASNPGRSPVA